MKKFIIQTSIFIILVSSLIFLVFLQADGTTDPYYLRFTTKKQSSIILGTSRAAQGITPEILNKALNKDFFNYSFTIAASPFGPTYLNSIKRKIESNDTNSIFIIAVDPWSISAPIKNSSSPIIETDKMLDKVNMVNMTPNIQYLIKCYNQKYYKIFSKKGSKDMILHKDGWLEINVDMDSINIKKRLDAKLENYKVLIETRSFSQERFKYLQKTIDYLSKHGSVYLVRLPIHEEMMAIENKFMPEFNLKINLLQNKINGYLDLTEDNSSYLYTDGNHLHKDSGKIVSKKIAKWIKLNSL